MLLPLIFSFITLLATCSIEYGTLTMKGSPFEHILIRTFAYALGTSLYFLVGRLGIKHYFFYYSISIVYLLAYVHLFTESLPQKIFLFFTEWCFTTFVSALCNWATAWIPAENLQVRIRLGLYIASFMVLLPLYIRYGRQYVREMLYLFDKSNPVYAAFPFLAFVLFTILFGPLNKTSSLFQFMTMALFICFILFTFYLMIMHFHTVFSKLQVEFNLRNAERQLTLNRKYYTEVDKGVRIQRERIHDTRHHLIALSAMAASGKSVALTEYLSRLLEQYNQSKVIRYCENDVANAVLGGYISIAEEKGISVYAELDLPQTMGIDEYELCTLFGNTVENAIEACQRIPQDSVLHPHRFIRLKSKVEQGQLTVRIENSFRDDPSVSEGDFTSSKGTRGGVGLESVRAVLDLYQGCLSCERHDGVFIFSAVLCLRPS